jgi:16S rRNA (guanine527-N7)-methyltransferase
VNEDRVEEELHEALGTSQRLGFLGDRPIDEVIEHARAFVSAVEGISGSVIDLGAGGGVPGLVLAVDRPDLLITLLDRRTKRTDFLSRMVRRMRLDHVTVVAADVDDAIRQGHVGFDAVVARGFGPPDFTLQTGARCLGESGLIVISEPRSGDRWDSARTESLGLVRVPSDVRVACFTRVSRP